EHVLLSNRARLEDVLHGIADRLFIAIAFGTIEVAKPHFQSRLCCLPSREEIGYQRPESQRRHRTGSVSEGNLRKTKSGGRRHDCPPPLHDPPRVRTRDRHLISSAVTAYARPIERVTAPARTLHRSTGSLGQPCRPPVP